MQLYTAPRAPNPRRVTMFIAEKGITGITQVAVDLNAQEHKGDAFRAKSPLAKVPALELDDGRILTETRAICTWLEGRFPEPNLMVRDFEERAFIEMADRRIEWYLFAPIGQCIRHSHPGLATLEQPQFPEFGASEGRKMRDVARWLDSELAHQPLCGRRALHHRRHHGVLRAGVRTRPDEVSARRRGHAAPAGLARPHRRAAQRPGILRLHLVLVRTAGAT